MIARNKWTGNLYEIVEDKGKTIVLKRKTDGKVFEILKSEFSFSYYNLGEKK